MEMVNQNKIIQSGSFFVSHHVSMWLIDSLSKYLEYVKGLPEKKRPKVSKSHSMHEASLGSVKLRLNSPYWLLHAGDCIHHIVFDHVRYAVLVNWWNCVLTYCNRLLHPTDPPSSAYPLTTQITPPLLDLCRACNKVPAVLSIVGDIRLGETPFVICRPCWKCMGMPKDEEAQRVIVVPLPKHEFGWGG